MERKKKRRKGIKSFVEAAYASNKCVIGIKMWFLLLRHESFQSKLTLIYVHFSNRPISLLVSVTLRLHGF